MSEWVSMEDRYPEVNQQVLANRKDKLGMEIMWLRNEDLPLNPRTAFMRMSGYPCPARCISHWMPLPNPPETEEQDDAQE